MEMRSFAVINVMFLILPIFITTGTGYAVGELGDKGNVEAKRNLDVVRVKSPEERERMKQYIEKLREGVKVVKSFPGPAGETIDCVDVYSQPALRRAGMKDHKIIFEPRNKPPQAQEMSKGEEIDEDKIPKQLYQLTGETCPEKTFPMTRLTMETLQRFETLDDFFKKRFTLIEKPFSGGGGSSGSSTHEYAHARRTVDNWGAESVLNLWSPFVDETDEFSLSQIWVVRGSGSNRETVEGGWQKYYDLYGDWRSRLFIYFTPDNYGSGGCYNLSCGAFVQTNSSVYIGGGFTNYSSVGGSQYKIKLLWYKDGPDGHWWLRYGNTWVGYYPRSLFDSNGLRNLGERVDFGGEIVNTSPGGAHTHTDMGSGYWPYQGFGYAAYQRNIQYVDTSNYYRRATGLSESRTNSDCYDIDLHETSGSWGVYFYFGGSGHNTNCP